VITMTRKYKVIALLLSLVLVIGLASCGSKSKKTASKKGSVKQVAQEPVSQTANPLPQAVPASVTEEDVPIGVRNLSPDEFGRDNPFVPLLAQMTQAGKKPSLTTDDKSRLIEANEARLMPKAVKATEVIKKADVLPDVRLTLVIDGNTAIFDENRISKVASIGDSIAGMKILEIKNNEAILGGGDKKYSVALGGRIEELPSSPAPILKQTPKVKETKIKK
jgi:hypothetical protein